MPRCCPNTPASNVPRSIHEDARDMAREIAKPSEGTASRRPRKKAEIRFAHLMRILKLDWSRPRGAGPARTMSSCSQQLPRTSEAGQAGNGNEPQARLRSGQGDCAFVETT